MMTRACPTLRILVGIRLELVPERCFGDQVGERVPVSSRRVLSNRRLNVCITELGGLLR